jgi:hypothetical protein
MWRLAQTVTSVLEYQITISAEVPSIVTAKSIKDSLMCEVVQPDSS